MRNDAKIYGSKTVYSSSSEGNKTIETNYGKPKVLGIWQKVRVKKVFNIFVKQSC